VYRPDDSFKDGVSTSELFGQEGQVILRLEACPKRKLAQYFLIVERSVGCFAGLGRSCESKSFLRGGC